MTTHSRGAPAGILERIDNVVRTLGHVICWANALLIGVIILQVILRYGLGNGQVALEELQWHLYALAVMMGLSYAQVGDSHIRVDIIHMRLSRRTQLFWEVVGILLFLLPFIAVVFWHSLDFVYDSWRTNESSTAPLGLPWRWLIKGVIPVSFGLLALVTLTRLLRSLAALFSGGRHGDQ